MKYGRNRHNNGYIGSPEMNHEYGRRGINNHYFVESKLRTPTDFQLERDVRYKRPTDWLAMPDMTNGDQKVAILLDIVNGSTGNTGATADSNFIAFAISGPYIVDWGDGTTQAFVAGATASKQYSWFGVSGGTNSDGNRQVLIQAYPQANSNFEWVDFNRRHPLPWTQSLSTVEYIRDIKISGTGISALAFCRSGVIPGNSTDQQVRMPILEKVEFVGKTNIKDANNMFNQAAASMGLKTVMGTEWTENLSLFTSMFQNCNYLKDVLDLRTPAMGSLFTHNFDFGSPNSNMFSSCTSLEYIPTIDMRRSTNFILFPGSGLPNLLFMEPFLVEGGCVGLNSFVLNSNSRLKIFEGWKGEIGPIGLTLPNGTVISEVNRNGYPFLYQLGSSSRTTNAIRNVSGTKFLKFIQNICTNNCSALDTLPMFNASGEMVNAIALVGASPNISWLPPLDLSRVQNINGLFLSCTGLRHFPTGMKLPNGLTGFGLTNPNAVLNFNNAFAACNNMSFPRDFTITIRGNNQVNLSSMFSSCYNLQRAPRIITPPGVIRFANLMFNNCSNLVDTENISQYDMTRNEDFTQMFQSCLGMTAAPNFSITGGVTFTGMFQDCRNLVIPPSMSGWGSPSTGNTMDASNMFLNCVSLGQDPSAYAIMANYDFTKVKNMSRMFENCFSLTKIPSENWNTSGVINMQAAFRGAQGGAEIVPFLNVSGVTLNSLLTSFASGPTTHNQLRRLGITGVRASIDVRNQLLSETALNDIFRGLSAGRGGVTAGTIRVITIMGNPGVLTCDRTLATSKQWTVTS